MEICDNMPRAHTQWQAKQCEYFWIEWRWESNWPLKTSTNKLFFWVEYKIHMQLDYETIWSQALKVLPPPPPLTEVSDPSFSSAMREEVEILDLFSTQLTARGKGTIVSPAKNQLRADLPSAVNLMGYSSTERQINRSSNNESACALPSYFTLLPALFSPPNETYELERKSKNQRFRV